MKNKKISVFTDVGEVGKAQLLNWLPKANDMHKPTHFQCPSIIMEKLMQLTLSLQQEHSYLKAIATESAHRQLRNSIYLAAQECNQYASEVNAQMAMLGYMQNMEDLQTRLAPMIAMVTPAASAENVKKAVRYCRETELRLVGAYREVLNEPFLMNDLRVLLRRQYNGVLCAFLQLKLLDENYIYCSDDYLGE